MSKPLPESQQLQELQELQKIHQNDVHDIHDIEVLSRVHFPREMWGEIMKHFKIQEREFEVTRRETLLAMKEVELNQLQSYIDEISGDIQNLAYEIRPICNKINKQIDFLDQSVTNKLVLLEPQTSVPIQNIQRYSERLKRIMRGWYL